jgi:ribosomal protein S20
MASAIQISAAPQQNSTHHSSLKSVAKKVVGAVKQHNKEINAAYQAYYGVNYQSSAEYLKKGQASRAPVTVSEQ